MVSRRIFLLLALEPRPSPTWCSLAVASAVPLLALRCCGPTLSTGVSLFYAKSEFVSPDFGLHNSVVRAADFCRNLVCGRPMEPVAFLLHLRLWPPVAISPLCVARLVCTEPGTRTRPPCLACFAPMLIYSTRTPTPPPVCSLCGRPARLP